MSQTIRIIPAELAQKLDSTHLKPATPPELIKNLCDEAIQYGVYGVCLNGCYLSEAKKFLSNSPVKLISVIGFPLGAMATEAKQEEAKLAREEGAQELDMVMNLGWFRGGLRDRIQEEIHSLVQQAAPCPVKVILETAALSREEISLACRLAEEAGAQFVKTSTGFGPGGATAEAVQLMRQSVSPHIGIKASGGIRSLEDALNMLDAGADRLGTSSAGKILEELKTQKAKDDSPK